MRPAIAAPGLAVALALGAAVLLPDIPTAPAAAAPGRPAQPVTPTLTTTPTLTAVPTAPGTETAPPTDLPPPPASPTLAASSTSAPEPGVPREERPIIIVDSYHADPSPVAAGGGFRLTIRVKNRGERFAENIQIGLATESFAPMGTGATLYAGNLRPGATAEVGLDMVAAAGLSSGVHPLGLRLSWDDSSDGAYSDSTSIGISVAGVGQGRPAVVITGSRGPGQVVPGTAFNLVLAVTNLGDRPARRLLVSPSGPPLAHAGAAAQPLDLDPGQSGSINLRLVAAGVEPGAAAQAFELRYDDPDGQRYTDTQTLGVAIAGTEAPGPLPTVLGYRTASPGVAGADAAEVPLHPGQLFDLVLDIGNVGVADAQRARLTLGLGGGTTRATAASRPGAFAPVGTSNVRFLDRLAAGEVRQVRQTMVVDGGADPGVYTLGVTFSFVDAQGRAQELGEVISLLVARRVRLSVNPVGVVTSTLVGGSMPFTVEVVNAGEGTVRVRDVIVTAGPELEVRDGRRYVGNLDAGALDIVEAHLTARTAGSSVVTVTVQYLDDFQRTGAVVEAFPMEVAESVAPPAQAAPPPGERNLLARILRGLLGIGASLPSGTQSMPEAASGVGAP